MEQFIQYLGLGWVGSALGIVGIVLSVWFYIKSVRTPAPTASIESIRLVGDAESALPKAVIVLYYDRSVPRVTRSTVRFWNAGNLTLEGTSVASSDPVRLILEPDEEFLSVTVTKLTREVTQFTAAISAGKSNEIIFRFDFLDPADGAIVECLHTGNKLSPAIKGIVKGIPKGIALKDTSGYKIPYRNKKKVYFRLFAGVSMSLSGVAMFVYLFFRPDEIARPMSRTMSLYFWLFMGIIYLGMGVVMLNSFRRPFPKGLMLPAAEDIAP